MKRMKWQTHQMQHVSEWILLDSLNHRAHFRHYASNDRILGLHQDPPRLERVQVPQPPHHLCHAFSEQSRSISIAGVVGGGLLGGQELQEVGTQDVQSPVEGVDGACVDALPLW